MAADKEIMKAIERLRLDRPGRVIEGTLSLGVTVSPKLIEEALTELATTFREEAELWSKSGAKGWKSSEAEKYLVAQHIDDVATQLDNAGGATALSVSVPQAEPATTHERLNDFVNSAIATGKGTLRPDIADDVTVFDPVHGVVMLADGRTMTAEFARDGDASGVAAYLRGDVDTLPGLAEALVPGSIPRMSEADNPFLVGEHGPELIDRETLAKLAAPYCSDCDHDTHRCFGCGEPVEHGKYACAQCELIHADGPPPCCEHMLDADEDPRPWCDCDAGQGRDYARPHDGPCRHLAHLRANHADVTPSAFVRAVEASGVAATWESDTLTADGFVKPGVAPTLGQPGDMGAGYSHNYVPPGGRVFTYADLLTPVPAASLPAHLSHSQGNTIGDCATKYRLQRVEQVPQIPQWANIGGTAAHACFEAIERMVIEYAQRHPSGGQLNVSELDVEQVWKHHFEGQIQAVAATTTVPISAWRAARKGAEGEQWWRVNGPLMLRRYLDARPDEPSLMIGMAADVAIEWEISADVPTPYGPIPFTAKIDRVTYDDRIGGYIIRDYKTSYERPTDTTQLGDYAHALILAKKIFADRPILGTYFDARRGEWTEPVDLLAAHPFEAFQYRVTTAHAQKRALITGPTPARPSSYCGGCSVRYACPIMATKS